MKNIHTYMSKFDFTTLVENEEKVSTRHYLLGVTESIKTTLKKNDSGIIYLNGFLYYYNSTYWEKLDRALVLRELEKCAVKCGVSASLAKYHKFKEQLFEQLKSSTLLSSTEIPSRTSINFLNGTLDINEEDVLFRPNDKRDYLTYSLKFKYDKNAKCTKFQKYLDQVLPEKEKQIVLFEYLGSIFESEIKTEKVLICKGDGANGKSVLFEIITALLGEENVSHYSLNKLTDSSGNSRANIAGKLLNIATEISGKFDSSIFKKLVSQEPVDARFLYENAHTITNYAKMAFSCNELPVDKEKTNAFYRRFLIVPFNITIPKEERNLSLAKEIIRSELTGIFNLVIDGLRRYRKQKGFSECKSCEKSLNDYRIEANSAAAFMDENYKPSNKDYISLYDLYSEYSKYCDQYSYKAVNKINFRKRIVTQGFQVKRLSLGLVVMCVKKDKPLESLIS